MLQSASKREWSRFENCAKWQPVRKYIEAVFMSERSSSASEESDDLLRFTGSIVAAYVSNNPVPVSELTAMIRSVHGALQGLGRSGELVAATSQKPAVPVKKSITPDYIICLEDGRKFKTLKRYLRGNYNLTPEQYRAKWGLPADYPMVAPNYSERRSQFAKQMGLGRAPKVKRRRKRS
jgi:predicted transcriptional regulator